MSLKQLLTSSHRRSDELQPQKTRRSLLFLSVGVLTTVFLLTLFMYFQMGSVNGIPQSVAPVLDKSRLTPPKLGAPKKRPSPTQVKKEKSGSIKKVPTLAKGMRTDTPSNKVIKTSPKKVAQMSAPLDRGLQVLLENAWENDSAGEQAINWPALEELSEEAFEKNTFANLYDENPLASAARVEDHVPSAPFSGGSLVVMRVIENAYDAQFEALADLKKRSRELRLAKVPEGKLVEPNILVAQNQPAASIKKKSVPNEASTALPSSSEPSKPLPPPTSHKPVVSQSLPQRSLRTGAPPMVASHQVRRHTEAHENWQEAEPVPGKSASEAEPSDSQSASISNVATVASAAKAPLASESKVTTQSDRTEVITQQSTIIDGAILGRLELDTHVLDELNRVKGHIELTLHPYGSRVSQHTHFFDYTFLSDSAYDEAKEFESPQNPVPEPNEDFELENRQLRGPLLLLANIYEKGNERAIAQIQHPERITADNYKQFFHFEINEAIYEKAKENLNSPIHGNSYRLSLSILEGPPSSPSESPTPIAGARVKVVGMEEQWGELIADGQGDLHIDGIPNATRGLKLRIEAGEAYYPTTKRIPKGHTYETVYLIPRDTVEVTTLYFTKSPQLENRGIVMGRILDPVSRQPKENESVWMSFSRTFKAIYYSLLSGFPNKDDVTDKSGRFAFFNAKGFKPLLRDEREDRRVLLLNVEKDTAQWVEPGVGGEAPLRLEVVDRFGDDLSDATLRWVGDPQSEYELNGETQVTYENVDLPPGFVLLELEVDGARNWYSLPWNTHGSLRAHYLHWLPSQMVEAHQEQLGIDVQPNTGSLIGGSSDPFLADKTKCVQVELYYANTGERVDDTHGPFSRKLDKNQQVRPECWDEKNRSHVFHNLPTGEYVIKWISTDENGHTQLEKLDLTYVGANRSTIAAD